jgi:hypothetical protein
LPLQQIRPVHPGGDHVDDDRVRVHRRVLDLPDLQYLDATSTLTHDSSHA